MKRIKFFILLSVLLSGIAHANTYYVSTAGNDRNPGTIERPFGTWEKGASVLKAGDILYIRGGTYRTTHPGSNYAHCIIRNLSGTSSNPIKIWAYPGEQPIFNLDNVSVSANTVIFYVNNCRYVHFKGLRFTGAPQTAAGYRSYAAQYNNSNNLITENCEADHCTEGFNSGGSSDLLYLNCDAHHLADPYSGYGGSNGFSTTAQSSTSVSNIKYKNCRAWWCSDDGFDVYGSEGTFTFDGCWSFWNGFIPGSFSKAGDGQGFKLGPTSSSQSSSLRRIVRSCISFQNRSMGFDQNAGNTQYQLYNNTAYANGTAGFFFPYFGTTKTVRNNISYANGTVFKADGGWIQSNNSWNGLKVTDSDFLSLNNTGVDGSRQADGSLPKINFLHLSQNSKLIDAGIDVGLLSIELSIGLPINSLLPFNGAAPDLGAFEYTSVAAVQTPLPNRPPTVNAGIDTSLTLPVDNVLLRGKAADEDGTIASYRWSKISGPSQFIITSPTQLQTTFTNLTEGVYQIELTVTDNQNATAKDTIKINVNPAPNQPPTANAGADFSITLPTDSILLSGNGIDTDGSIASYQWFKISGPSQATIASATQPQTLITNLTEGVYRFELKVTDNLNSITTDTMELTVNAVPNQPPTANAGADFSITLPTDSILLSGNGIDTDGSIASYQWFKISGPSQATIAAATQPQTLITNLTEGVYRFELKVTDNLNSITTDTMELTVNAVPNQPPTANAGADFSITLPTDSILLSGNGIDTDGSIASYQWFKISGPSQATIAAATQPQTLITNLTEGVYRFELKVTDNLNSVATDTMELTVNPVVVVPSKSVKVNIYGGINPYEDSQWNNWNTYASYSSEILNYTDGTISEISAKLSLPSWSSIADNLPDTVGAIMAPSEVLRYTSQCYKRRTLTIHGLSTSEAYNLEFYSSRNINVNSKTIFSAGAISDTVNTYNNKTDKAEIINIIPNENGQIIIIINSQYGYNYLNGFTITENKTPDSSSSVVNVITKSINNADIENKTIIDNEASLKIYPNPVRDNFNLELNNTRTGKMIVQIIDQSGAIKRTLNFNKYQQSTRLSFQVNDLSSGIYFIRIQIGAWNETRKLLKL